MSGHEAPWGECESCGWETDDLIEVDCWARVKGVGPESPEEEKVFAWMCKVCYSSPAGTSYKYGWSDERGAQVLRMIAWQTNYLASLKGTP
jgi:hypothetical protein